MNKYIMITTTFNDENNCEEVIRSLLDKKLISCAQRFNITSSYHWKCNIGVDDEILVQLKTKKSLYEEVEKEILNLHNYEIPQIIAYDIVLGSKEYLNWIEEETK